MKALARFFIRRPATSGMLAVALLLAGLLGMGTVARRRRG